MLFILGCSPKCRVNFDDFASVFLRVLIPLLRPANPRILLDSSLVSLVWYVDRDFWVVCFAVSSSCPGTGSVTVMGVISLKEVDIKY